MNGFSDDQYKVVYKRPTDLLLKDDVPICCNVCVNEFLDEGLSQQPRARHRTDRGCTAGLLTSGIVPAFRHVLDDVMIRDPILIPSSATVFVQAIELRTDRVCGLDMSAVDQYRRVTLSSIHFPQESDRWMPFFTCGLPLDSESYRTLSEAREAWHFDFYHPPDASDRKTVDLNFVQDGVFNAVLFWYELDLGEGLRVSTSPDGSPKCSQILHPAVQYMAGQLQVACDMIYPLVCSHNTVR